jgi:Cys-tRNA(Pro)/Cys-tRNA(Cys) deacylase
VVDESALAFETVLVSGGRRGLQVELPPADLVRLTAARTAPIGR